MDVRLGAPASGALAGLRVLDFSTVVSGPLCTQVLGDLGADVVKIESPGGDSTRRMGPPFKGGLSAIFTQFNRNKRSLVLDLKMPEAVEAARALARRADVVVHNFRPGVMERLGLGYDALSAENQRLVYLAISGFGPEGPYAAHPAYDTVIQGLASHMRTQGGEGSPALIRSLVADKSTGLSATYAVLAALVARERGGRGQAIDVAMLDAFAAFILPDGLLRNTFLPDDEWSGLPDFAMVHRTWPTADGHVVIMFVEEHQWRALCEALEAPTLAADPRFSSLVMRIANFDALVEALGAEVRRWPTAALVERARALGAPMAPANGVAEFLADPQVAANRTVFEAEDPAAGRIRYLRNPARLRGTPPALRRHPPRLGEHSEEVLREAGYSSEAIDALLARGAAGGDRRAS
jgi:crotonobetainyl-CoA:carnitine CoA-transferase CaiB-like acyl-CoA transferase